LIRKNKIFEYRFFKGDVSRSFLKKVLPKNFSRFTGRFTNHFRVLLGMWMRRHGIHVIDKSDFCLPLLVLGMSIFFCRTRQVMQGNQACILKQMWY